MNVEKIFKNTKTNGAKINKYTIFFVPKLQTIIFTLSQIVNYYNLNIKSIKLNQSLNYDMITTYVFR